MFKTLFPKIFSLTLLLALAASIIASQSEQTTPTTDQPAVEPTPSPAITDNATLNLHRWGAVTLFHGLPSDRVNAIAEDSSGACGRGAHRLCRRVPWRERPGPGSVPQDAQTVAYKVRKL